MSLLSIIHGPTITGHMNEATETWLEILANESWVRMLHYVKKKKKDIASS